MNEYLDFLVSNWSSPVLLLVVLVSLAILARGADRLVDSAVAMSRRFGVPRVVVGATIVSLGTTMPEAVVSVFAAVQGRSEMALGNAVGSIICDTGLILGIGCLIAPLPLDMRVVNRQGWVNVGTGFLLVLVCLPWADPSAAFVTGGTVSQAVGWGFLALLLIYLVWSVRLARAGVGTDADDVEGALPDTMSMVLGLFAGLVMVIVSSALLISSAAEFAERINVPSSIIAATLVAFGTSLPELVVVVTATWKGHGELAVGNVIGADVLNVLFVVGGAAAVTATGLHADPVFFVAYFPAMLFLLLVFRIGVWTAKNGTLGRPVGMVLLATYVVLTGLSYLTSIPQPTG